MILNEKQIIRNQIVSEKNEWLWSSIAKNASTTVTNSIIHNFVDKEIKDTHFYIRNNTKNNKDVSSLSFFENKEEILNGNFFKFVILNDPKKRIISSFYDKLIKNKNYERNKEFYNYFELNEKDIGKLNNDVLLHLFLKYLVESDRNKIDSHFANQSALVPSSIRYDMFLSVSNLNNDWEELRKNVKIPSLDTIRHNNTGSEKFLKFLEENDRYKKIVKTLNYLSEEEDNLIKKIKK